MKISKVKQVQGSGTYDSKFGLLYKFEYLMEDGTVLTANHKTADGNFKIGETVEYEIKGSNDYGSWGKVGKPQEEQQTNNYKKMNTKGNNASFALSYAKDLCVGGVIKPEQILTIASKFNTWLDNPTEVTTSKKAPEPVTADNDLPF